MNKKLLSLGLMAIGLMMVLVVGLMGLTAVTPPDTEMMTAANNLYVNGHYSEAATIYEQMAAQGVTDSTLFYNLGNAYYQQGDLGRAVLNYQRAAELDPRDADIEANLELVRTQVANQLPSDAAGPLVATADLTDNWLTLNETAVIALSLWFVLVVLLLARDKLQGTSRKLAGYATVAVLVFLLVTGVSLGSRMALKQTAPGGVVISDRVALSVNPGEGINIG